MRSKAPDLSPLYDATRFSAEQIPDSLVTSPGKKTTLRGSLGNVLNHLNQATQGAFIGASADLMNSTSLSLMAKGMSGSAKKCIIFCLARYLLYHVLNFMITTALIFLSIILFILQVQ